MFILSPQSYNLQCHDGTSHPFEIVAFLDGSLRTGPVVCLDVVH